MVGKTQTERFKIADTAERERRELVEQFYADLGYPPHSDAEEDALHALLREGDWRKGAR